MKFVFQSSWIFVRVLGSILLGMAAFIALLWGSLELGVWLFGPVTGALFGLFITFVIVLALVITWAIAEDRNS